MKVILLKDVAKIGRKFDVVNVPDGFALNKLLPKNMAQSATPENMKRLQNLSSKMEHDRQEAANSFAELLSIIKDIEVNIEVEANAEGRMFQTLKTDAIVDAVKHATGKSIEAEHVLLKEPIKSVGEHTIEVVSGEKHGTLTLHIVPKSK